MILNLSEVASNFAATRNMDMSRDGNWIAAVPFATGSVTTFPVYKKNAGGDFSDAAINLTIPVSTPINVVVFSPDSQKLAVGTGNNNIYLFNLISGTWTYDKAIPIGFTPAGMDFAKDNIDIMIGSTSGMTLVFNTVTSAELYRISYSVSQFYVDATITTSDNVFVSSSTSTNTTSYGVNVYIKSGSTYLRTLITNFSFQIYGCRISADGLKVYLSTNNGVYILRRSSTSQTFNPNIYYGKSTTVTRDVVVYKDRYLVGTGNNAFTSYDSRNPNKYLEASVLYETQVDGINTNNSYVLASNSSTDMFVAYTTANIIPKVYKISERTISDAVYKNGNTITGYAPPNYQFALSPDKTKFFSMFSTKVNNSPSYNFGDISGGQLLTNNRLSFNKTQAVSVAAGRISSFSNNNTYFGLTSGDLLRIFYKNTDNIYDEVDISPALTIAPIVARFSPDEQYITSFNRTVVNIHRLNGSGTATLVTVNLNGVTLAGMSDIIWYSNTEFIISSFSAGMYFFRYNPTTLVFDLVRTLTSTDYALTSMTMSADKRFIYAVKNTASGTFWGAKYTVTDFDNISYTGTFTENYGAGDQSVKFIRLSPDGTKMLVTGNGTPNCGIYNVNPTTGDVSSLITLASTTAASTISYGSEWLTNDTFALGYNGEYVDNRSLRIFRFDSATNTISDESSLHMPQTSFSSISNAAISADAQHVYVSASSTVPNSTGITRYTKNSNGHYVRIGLLDTVSSSGVAIFANGAYMLAASASSNANNFRLYSKNAQGIFETFVNVTVSGALNSSFFNKIDDNNIVFQTSSTNGGYYHYNISNSGVITKKADIPRPGSTSYYYVGASYNGQYIYFSDTTTTLRIYEKQASGDYTLKTTQTVFNANFFRLWSNPTNPAVGLLKVSTTIYYTDINTDGTFTVSGSNTIQTNAVSAGWYGDGKGFFINGVNPASSGQTFNYLFDNTTKKYFRKPLDDYPTGATAGALVYTDQATDSTNPAKDVTVYIQSTPTTVSTTNVNYGSRLLGIQTVETEKVITSNLVTNLNPITTAMVGENDLAITANTLINSITTTGNIDNPIVGNSGITIESIQTSGFFGEKANYSLDLSLTTAFVHTIPEEWSSITTTPLEQPYAYGSTLINSIVTAALAGLEPEIKDGDAVINSIITDGLLGEEGSITGDTLINSVINDGEVFSTPFVDSDTLIESISMEGFISDVSSDTLINSIITDGFLSDGVESSIAIILNNITSDGLIDTSVDVNINTVINNIETEASGDVEIGAWLDTIVDSIITAIDADVISNFINGDVLLDSITSGAEVLVGANAELDILISSIVSESEARVSGNIMASNTFIPSIVNEGLAYKMLEIDGAIRLNRILATGDVDVQMFVRGDVTLNSIVTEAVIKRILRKRFLNIV